MNYHYARFAVNGAEQCGTDSYLPLDRRLSLPRVLDECRKRAHNMRFIRKYDGVNLYTSPLSCLKQTPHSSHNF